MYIASKLLFMSDYYTHILETTIEGDNNTHHILVEAAIDVDSEYTGRYRVTLDDKSTFLIHTPDLGWIEEEHGVTELSKKIGYMIENHEA